MSETGSLCESLPNSGKQPWLSQYLWAQLGRLFTAQAREITHVVFLRFVQIGGNHHSNLDLQVTPARAAKARHPPSANQQRRIGLSSWWYRDFNVTV
jgi:hypothetical protein